MALSQSEVSRSNDQVQVDVTATADADTAITIVHGLGNPPPVVGITQLLTQAITALSAWAATTIDGTNVILTKTTATGSGDAAAQVRAIISRRR